MALTIWGLIQYLCVTDNVTFPGRWHVILWSLNITHPMICTKAYHSVKTAQGNSRSLPASNWTLSITYPFSLIKSPHLIITSIDFCYHMGNKRTDQICLTVKRNLHYSHSNKNMAITAMKLHYKAKSSHNLLKVAIHIKGYTLYLSLTM